MNLNPFVLTRAPTRICDIGGWTDTWFYPKGAVVSFCVDLYSYVRLVENKIKKIRIFGENLEQSVEICNLNKIEYNGVLDLIKAAIKKMNVTSGLDIFVRADAPPGCGIGTSASVAVALISALAKYLRLNMDQYAIATLAHKLEIEELKLESGVQDQYAATFGGVNFLEIDYPKVKIVKIEIDDKRIVELENQFILVYFSSRSSSKIHSAVISNYKNRDALTINSFEIMRECAYEMKTLINSDLEILGEIINRNWEAQKTLHPLMINPVVNKAEKIAMRYGALGFKCNGAGGGGSATILADYGHEYQIKKVLIKNGYTILPCKLNFTGVRSYS